MGCRKGKKKKNVIKAAASLSVKIQKPNLKNPNPSFRPFCFRILKLSPYFILPDRNIFPSFFLRAPSNFTRQTGG